MTSDPSIPGILASQYRAGLRMLREAIESCPEEEWANPEDRNPMWQMAYHALFFTHMYLQRSLNRFKAWGNHEKEYAALGEAAGVTPLTKAYVLEYWSYCDAHLDQWVNELDLTAETCGFRWYKLGKLEHQIVNIRHVQHHAAQMADRLRSRRDFGVAWEAAGGSAPTT